MTSPTQTIRVVREATVPAGPTCGWIGTPQRCGGLLLRGNYCVIFDEALLATAERDIYYKCAPCLTACAEAEQATRTVPRALTMGLDTFTQLVHNLYREAEMAHHSNAAAAAYEDAARRLEDLCR